MDQVEANNVVRQCADLRERAANEPMTIATAIERAQSWRKCPELVVDTFTAKIVADTLLAAIERSRCYYNATLRGQDTFVLAQQDRAAPAAIDAWAMLAAAHGCPDDKVQHALVTAESWRVQPMSATKWPD
jgi:hypothetical protein